MRSDTPVEISTPFYRGIRGNHFFRRIWQLRQTAPGFPDHNCPLLTVADRDTQLSGHGPRGPYQSLIHAGIGRSYEYCRD